MIHGQACVVFARIKKTLNFVWNLSGGRFDWIDAGMVSIAVERCATPLLQ